MEGRLVGPARGDGREGVAKLSLRVWEAGLVPPGADVGRLQTGEPLSLPPSEKKACFPQEPRRSPGDLGDPLSVNWTAVAPRLLLRRARKRGSGTRAYVAAEQSLGAPARGRVSLHLGGFAPRPPGHDGPVRAKG